MQRNYFLEKGYKQFLLKNKTRATRKEFICELLFSFNFFHVFFIEVLNIILNQNKNMHIFTRKISKVEQHSLRTSFCRLVQTLQFFLKK